MSKAPDPIQTTIWQPTPDYRWFVPDGKFERERILQRAWSNERGAIEWRPLETVWETEADKTVKWRMAYD